ncbi:TetR/AcrR family transcriptional regulator [Streptococcus tangpeifui]|uniref:TetR/AcrR family transcriptional regulator n=1 Tax=Streptococcus tangpeifui TaxID=2709400 RepID=UPI0013ECF6B9|nr:MULTISPECIES: TetR/AcrR family transcriptional regulator [unclassified Streptococcus]
MSQIRQTQSVKHLKNALIDLLLEKDYFKISIGEIAKRANVSRGTFYQHFLDKDDLAYTIGEETLERFWNILSKGNLSKREKIVETLEEIQLDFKHFKAISQASHMEFSQKVQELIRNIINNNPTLKNKMKTHTGISNDIIIQVFCASFETVISSWIKNDLREKPSEITDIIMKIENIFW